ncbi:MAG TPA: translocation/assembly module TamB domain-containing protein [Gemmatimonadaceae bacterium]
MRGAVIRGLAVILALAIIAVAVMIVLTNTDWGREQVRKRVVAAIQGTAHGIVRTGRVTGNLLKGFTIHDLVITDSSGAPFVDIEEVRARYGLNQLRSKHVYLDDVVLIRPIMVLDRKTGGVWNYQRIFPRDTLTPEGLRPRGWGTWVRFTDLTIVDGDYTLRSPWEPDTRLTGAKREDAIRVALGPDARLVVERVGNGYQKVSKFHHVYATIPFFRVEDPNYKARIIQVSSARMIAEPFRPPMADVRNLRGTFEFDKDSAWWQTAQIEFPASRLSGPGKYNFNTNDFHLRLRANPVAARDIQWVYPQMPESGSGTLDFDLDWVGDTSIYTARNTDFRLETAHFTGDLGVTITDHYSLHDTDLRFTNVDTRLIERMFPPTKIARSGILSGRAKVEGDEHAMDVDADVVFDDRRAGRSHVLAKGEVGFGREGFNARSLRLTMRPLQVDMLRSYASRNMPVDGTLSGTATLNGSLASMRASADVTHVDRGNTSALTGTVAMRKGASIASSWFDVDARLHPLSLVEVGRLFPSAGLRGTATGPIRLTGTTRNLSVKTDLGLPDGGFLSLTGMMDLASRQKGYDVVAKMQLFNANTILAKAPRTSVTGDVRATGRGFDPATMNTTLVADLKSSTYDTLSINSALVRLTAANGLARIDTLALEIPYGIAKASGTFGLKPGVTGELRYSLRVDSLSRLAPLFPAQQGEFPPRPGILARRIERARSDSARIAEATEVRRAAIGGRPPTLAAVDTPRAIPRTQLSGRVTAEGVATGNIKNFGARGTATGDSIVALGNSVEHFRADYNWTAARTPQSLFELNADATNLLTAGFDLDSVKLKLGYRKPNGSVTLTINQDDKTNYAANAAFVLNKDRNEIRFNELRLKFDSSLWASTGPSLIHWGRAGIDVDKLELRNGGNGRIFVDGLIPKEGSANLQVAVDNFAVEDVVRLTQSDINARGLVSFDVRAVGTAANPTFTGAFGTQNFIYNGTAIPEIHGTVQYANQTLTGRADANAPGGGTLLVAEGTVPINLAFTGVTGSRLPKDRQIALTVKSDSLPLAMVPQLSTYVSNLKGRAIADLKIAGTLSKPEVTGQFALNDAAALIIPLGVNLNDIDGTVRMLHDTLIVDSLVARSDGWLKITGGIGIATPREPSFDLKLRAVNAHVLSHKDKGDLHANADLTIEGPFKNVFVGGNVRIRNGVLYIPESEGKKIISADDPAVFNVLDTAVAANREIFPAQSPILRNLRMDVNLRVDHDVFVRSRDANVEVYSDGDLSIRVNRATQSLILDGVLLSERGEYTFLTKRFVIKRGSATFANLEQINPTLQVTGEYEVRLPSREAINVRILIGGTMLNPRISLESDAQPPISQSDLLSYLAFGRSSSALLQLEGTGVGSNNNLVGAGAALATQQLAGVALGVLADEFAGEAARQMGADVFNITPADVQTDVGNFLRATEIEFGKYIASHTFMSLKARPDPQALRRPGLFVSHRFGGFKGYRLETSFEPRYLLREPTLALQTPRTTTVLGMFLIREWRY